MYPAGVPGRPRPQPIRTAGGLPVGDGPAAVLELELPDRGRSGATNLVVGVDGSPASLAALAKAAEIGIRLDAELRVVHAVDLSDYPVDPDGDDWELQAARHLEETQAEVTAALAGYPGGWTYRALRAEPADGLIRAAEQCDALMIVVGARSHGWRHLLERMAAPSVAHRLINHCHRPVLVVTHHLEG